MKVNVLESRYGRSKNSDS